MRTGTLVALALLFLALVLLLSLLRRIVRQGRARTKTRGVEPMTRESPGDLSHEDTRVFKVTPDMNLAVRGLPSALPRGEQNRILASLVRNALRDLPERTYQKGERIYEGRARLRIQDRIYPVVFALDATRLLTALETYKAAFDTVNAGAAAGVYDQELAALTADHIRQMAWQEIQEIRGYEEAPRQKPAGRLLRSKREKRSSDQGTEPKELPATLDDPTPRDRGISKVSRDSRERHSKRPRGSDNG